MPTRISCEGQRCIGMANLWWIKRTSVERQGGREGEGRMKKKVNQLFWLSGIREPE